MKNILFKFLIVILVGCNTTRKSATTSSSLQLKFLSDYTIPFDLKFKATTVGGLSGIDRDETTGLYYLISDDRSDINPARFYTANIQINNSKIDTVIFNSVHPLLQYDGKEFPNTKSNALLTPDPEAIRYLKTDKIIWTSEGERLFRNRDTILRDPFIYVSTSDGKFLDSFQIPSIYHVSAKEKGPRRNGVFEGASLNASQTKLFVNIEEPLYEDGERAGTKDSTALIRILQFDVKSKQFEKDFAYRIDPVAHVPNPTSAFRINGVPDVLAINDHELLVVERSFSTGRVPCTIKIFITDLNSGEAIQNKNITDVTPLRKRLLLNMDDLNIFTDNIEGICFGPRLSNGNQTLLFISDDNFSKTQRTQFLLFEIKK